MFDLRHEIPADVAPREALLDRCFGPGRLLKTSERLRDGRLPAEDLALTLLRRTELVGTIRLWDVSTGADHPALLLGPVAVAPELQGLGLGSRLVGESLARARALGHRAVILVGDAPYYARFGFSKAPVARLDLPGPYDPARFLGLELTAGGLAGASGLVHPTGAMAPAFGDWVRRPMMADAA